MFCEKCGSEIMEGASFCPNCGAQVGANNQTNLSQPNYNQPSYNNQPNYGQPVSAQQTWEQTPQPGKKVKKKNTGLSTAAAVLSLLGCTILIGVILAIIDLCKNKNDGNKHTGSYFALIMGALWLIFVVGFGSSKSSDSSKTTNSESAVTTEQSSSTSSAEAVNENIDYLSIEVSQLMTELNTNAMKAQDTYKNQYLEITGKLSNIDASGSYISLTPSNEEYAITGVQCFLNGDVQKNQVMNMSEGDIVTLRGKCTDVGEVLGYQLKIDSIDGYEGEASEEVSSGPITCSASDLVKDINDNAMKAQKKYEGQTITVTGKLSNIDASGKYIIIDPEDDPYSFVNIMCNIKTDDVKNRVMDLAVGDVITIKGKCTGVGEVLGYTIDMESIE